MTRPRNNRERERPGAGTGSCMFQSFNKNAGVCRSCLQSLTSQGLVELSALNLAAWRYPTTAIHPGHCWTSIRVNGEIYRDRNTCV